MFKVLLKHLIYDTAIAVFLDNINKNFVPKASVDINSLSVGDLIIAVDKDNSRYWIKGYVNQFITDMSGCKCVGMDCIEESGVKQLNFYAMYSPEYYYIYKQ